MVLPCTIFQFTQSPEDYYKSPLVGTYFRLIRFLCIPVSLLLMPLFLLLTAYFPEQTLQWQLLTSAEHSPARLTFYVLAVEFFLDLFQYAGALSSGKFSGSLSIVGGLLIGDIAVSLNWASTEVLFYGAVTLLCSLSIFHLCFSEAIRIYRIFLILSTGLFGVYGFAISSILTLVSIITTPTYGGFSYFWPLFPFNGKALYSLLFRSPTYKAQPSRVWNRGHMHPSKKS
jgi:stage V sporulation protein AF